MREAIDTVAICFQVGLSQHELRLPISSCRWTITGRWNKAPLPKLLLVIGFIIGTRRVPGHLPLPLATVGLLGRSFITLGTSVLTVKWVVVVLHHAGDQCPHLWNGLGMFFIMLGIM